MSRILLVIMALITLPLFAQEKSKVKDFHRLLIFNEKHKLMVVNIKDTDLWVTPGLYSQNKELPNENLQKLAAEYGLTVSQPLLRGVFTLKNNKTKAELKRLFYNVNVTGGVLVNPDNIEAIKWLSVSEAMKVITFPHINTLIKQVMDYPDFVWTGTILRYTEDDVLKAKMVDDFVPLDIDNKL